MRIAVAAAAMLVLAPVLTACTTGASTTPAVQIPPALVAAESHSDVGNDRPESSYDGLMVRRRTVLVFRVGSPRHVTAIQSHLLLAARRSSLELTAMQPGVLDPLPLEQFAPDLVMALPPGGSLAEGQRLMNRTRRGGWGSMIKTYGVLSVLVHDLRFTVDTAHPAAVAKAIAREGILSDALGNYLTDLGHRKLHVLYTGPLLSDGTVHAVRLGIARRADVAPAAVVVGPRTRIGNGVDLATEPTPAPEQFFPLSGHTHDH